MTSNSASIGRVAVAALAAGMLVLWTVAASAQGPRRGGAPRLAPEEVAKVWEIQAKGVAKDLGLAEGTTAKLVEAYKNARRSHGDAMREAMREGERGPERFQAMQDLNQAERAKLKSALSAFLNDNQVAKVLPTLGSFNRQWDHFVNVLSGYDLDEAESQKGLDAIAKYVVATDKARDEAIANMDFQSMRSAMQTNKNTLDTKMAGILSESQLAEWKEATEPRGGPGGRRGGPGGRPGGPGENPPPPPRD